MELVGFLLIPAALLWAIGTLWGRKAAAWVVLAAFGAAAVVLGVAWVENHPPTASSAPTGQYTDADVAPPNPAAAPRLAANDWVDVPAPAAAKSDKSGRP